MQELTRVRKAGLIMFGVLAVLWVIQIINSSTGYALDTDFGIRPHVLDRLPDILAAPFLHASWGHIEGNSLPLLILGFLAAFRSIGKWLGVTAVVILTSGAFVWLTAPANSITIGASGVIAGWLGYVMLRGVFDRRLSDILLGLLAAFLYLGSFDFFPNNSLISWQAHLGGLLGGLACAWIFRVRPMNDDPVPADGRTRAPASPEPPSTARPAPAPTRTAKPVPASQIEHELSRLRKEVETEGTPN